MKDFKKVFKELARAKQATAADHLEYFILKAISAKSNHSKAQIASEMIKEAFRPVTNKVKLENGMHPHHGLDVAMAEAWIYPVNFEELSKRNLSTRPLLECIENDLELKQYQSIIKEIKDSLFANGEFLDKDYSFFFVRDDIDPSYQAVQAAHAALLLGQHLSKKNINLNDLNFVVCAASSEQIDKYIPERIKASTENVELVKFVEPDIGNKVTCIATTPIPYSHKNVFGDFKLLKFYGQGKFSSDSRLAAG